jgi:hypothetical protein
MHTQQQSPLRLLQLLEATIDSFPFGLGFFQTYFRVSCENLNHILTEHEPIPRTVPSMPEHLKSGDDACPPHKFVR